VSEKEREVIKLYIYIMPFQIKKVGDKYKVYNLEKKRYAKATFKTRQSASNQAKNWERYSKIRTGKK
tara:strand:+ start:42 stop:242 length:201 start_codon:yes stop_codon:yes gene_type:complete